MNVEPKIGDIVYFDECPRTPDLWDAPEQPHGKIVAFVEDRDVLVEVEVEGNPRCWFEMGGSLWSLDARFKREQWGYTPPRDMPSGWLEAHYHDPDEDRDSAPSLEERAKDLIQKGHDLCARLEDLDGADLSYETKLDIARDGVKEYIAKIQVALTETTKRGPTCN